MKLPKVNFLAPPPKNINNISTSLYETPISVTMSPNTIKHDLTNNDVSMLTGSCLNISSNN